MAGAAFVTWRRRCFPIFLIGHLFFHLSSLCSLKGSHCARWHSKSWALSFASCSYLDLFCLRSLSFHPIYLFIIYLHWRGHMAAHSTPLGCIQHYFVAQVVCDHWEHFQLTLGLLDMLSTLRVFVIGICYLMAPQKLWAHLVYSLTLFRNQSFPHGALGPCPGERIRARHLGARCAQCH